jgi:hypothetical protein
MLLEHLAQPIGEDLELLGPGQERVEVEVDLDEHAVSSRSWSCC